MSGKSLTFWGLLLAFLFALAVFREVLPLSDPAGKEESLVELRDRLAAERAGRREELEAELQTWKEKNARLQARIERLKAESE